MMSSERCWILVLAGVSFLAGAGAGVLWALDRLPARERAPLGGYEERLAREFGLDPEQRQDLHTILTLYHADVEELKVRQMGGAEAELVKLGLTCRDRIRKWVLGPEQRERFDRLAGAPGSDVPSTP